MGISPHYVGLDLGSSGLRAVELKFTKRTGTYLVHRAAAVDLQEGAISSGVIAQPAIVAKALRRLWRKGRFSTRKVAFGLSDTGVITRKLELPWMPPNDFRVALRYQIGDALPVDLTATELDYLALSESQATDKHGQVTDMLQFLLVATNSEAVAAVAEVLISARLEPVIADTTAFALIRTASGGVISGEDGFKAIIDIGADAVTAVIYQKGQPRFIRSIPHQGGDVAVDSLVSALNIDIDDATDLLWQTGLNGPPPIVTPIAESNVFGSLSSASVAPLDPKTKRAMAVINPWATTLVGTIRDSLDYFQSTGETSGINRLTLTGRTSRLNGLAERITTEMGISVDFLEPFSFATRSRNVKNLDSTPMAIATGLAMGVR